MMKKILAGILTVVLTFSVVFITVETEKMKAGEEAEKAVLKEQGINELPDYYYNPVAHGGTLVSVEYDVTLLDRIFEENTVSGWFSAGGEEPPEFVDESQLAKKYTFVDSDKDGENDGITVTKSAMVYLPYNYNPENEYDIMYLIHGRGGDYRTWLGTPDDSKPFKNVMDNMILRKDIKPMIVVCPGLTYAYGQDDRIMDGMSHEISHELMETVESEYSTYTDGIAPEDFEASRDHRCITGFSMGGSVTWHVLKDHPDYFRYYIPMSMALYYDRYGFSKEKNRMAVEAIEKNIKKAGYTKDDIVVYAATGSDDHKAGALAGQVALMDMDTDVFELTDDEYGAGNMMLKCWPDRFHSYTESFSYIYDGLTRFFHRD